MKIRSGKRKSSRPLKHKKWQVQVAKAKFSGLINEVVSSGYQIITKNGETVAYVVSKKEFDRYVKPKKSLLEALDACPYPDVDLDFDRSTDSIREIDL